jgi:hypothetical protein
MNFIKKCFFNKYKYANFVAVIYQKIQLWNRFGFGDFCQFFGQVSVF